MTQYINYVGNNNMDLIIIAFIVFLVLIGITYQIQKHHCSTTFVQGNTPRHRICKKCGSQQIMRESTKALDGKYCMWWEEVIPGNNENCPCHKCAETH